MAKTKRYLVGFDLGATKMQAGLIGTDFRVLARHRMLTEGARGEKAIVRRIVACIRQVLKKGGGSPILGIGIGSPGPLDPEKGVILDTPNMGLRNTPLAKLVSEAFHVPVAVDNDVNMGVYGELHFGCARGLKDVVGIFPGTGIGGGLVLNGQLYRGSTGNAGEVGHMIMQIGGPRCGCGQRGCLEALASRLAVSKEAVSLAVRGRAPCLMKNAGTDLAKISSRPLKQAVRNGDEFVKAEVERAAFYIGVAMANLVNVLSPQAVVLGGGLVEAFPKLMLRITRRVMREHAMAFLVKDVQVRIAKLGDDAVMMGAAKLIHERLQAMGRLPSETEPH